MSFPLSLNKIICNLYKYLKEITKQTIILKCFVPNIIVYWSTYMSDTLRLIIFTLKVLKYKLHIWNPHLRYFRFNQNIKYEQNLWKTWKSHLKF